MSIDRRRLESCVGPIHEWLLIIYLTISALGLQVLWSTEMGQASPYLLSLGMSKSAMSAVFLAGPLSGLIMQPLVGIYADACKHPLGRRRPFIILGTLVAILSIVLFVWARELVGVICTSGSQLHRTMSIWLASISFYAMDFSMNVVMAAARSLLVDCLPSAAQARAHAYNSRIAGAGSVAIHALSQANLPELLNTPSLSQLKIITILAVVVFGTTQAITCLKIHERPLSTTLHDQPQPRLSELVSTLYYTWVKLEGSLVRPMCWVMFWCSIGWFPVLFYSSTWVGEIWAAGRTIGNDREEATRVGSLALLAQASVSFAAALALPLFFAEPSPVRSVALARLWAGSQALLAFLMFFAWLWDQSITMTMIMIALTGFCWTVTIWVPHTLVGLRKRVVG
ncbi:hypothetical protein CROQUDRAFT_483012 [Cronartium quercuum f. sp. fusiforme G11]|uniref:General alpha-glucoside permease n=1 Tax=Cronartium quercuum f. sp. fusiforme G11 TaxID=708437 RepID=A0A9P6TDV9_9BASI|nr:hypothetical protein CROQUDRAFT_483012 [Cronartium quercuum f. sp. fusiforme G11]